MITVVGAGPAGLALAYYLQKKGLTFQVLEKGEIAESWATYYDHLRLHTRKANVALPGLRLSASADAFPTRAQYLSYLRQYADHFAFPVQTGVNVLEATYRDGWILRTSRGCFETDTLVMATGIFNCPVVPRLPGQAQFQGEVHLAQAYRRPDPYSGRRVLVVGAGNTGVGVALELAEAGVEVGIVIRDGIQLVPAPKTALGTRLEAYLLKRLPAGMANRLLSFVRRDDAGVGLPRPSRAPRDVTPVVGLDLVEAVKRGAVKVHPAVQALSDNGVRFGDGSEASYDVLLLAAGYQPSLDALPFPLTLDDKGRFVQSPPKLHSIGFFYPTMEPFLVAVKREAAELANQLVAEGRQSV